MNIVVEYCSICETEVAMFWNVSVNGYKAFCPRCGHRLMLCDECQHQDGELADNCDYCAETDTCRNNQTTVSDCTGCRWKDRYQKCSCCRRNRHLKDNYEEEKENG